MGRELKRKQAKRDGKNVREVQKKEIDKPLSPKTLGFILLVILLFFVILYILTGLFITKELKWFNNDTAEEDVTEIEDRILAVDSLKQMDIDYYVYFYDTTNENVEISNLMHLADNRVYRVDLNDGFNSNYVGEPSGIVENISDLRVSDPTVIKVSDEKIVAFYNGEDEIKIAFE